MKRLGFLFAIALLVGMAARPSHAADPDQSNWIWPVKDIATTTLADNEALIVVGYSLRGVEMNGFGVQFPVHLGWMPFDSENGKRTAQGMVVTTERCARNASTACTGIQYRAYRVPAGYYSLAWIFRGQLFALAHFQSGGLRMNRNTQEILSADFSDDATIQLGVPGFNVAAGDVVYLGDLLVNFEKDKFPSLGWSTAARDEAGAAAILQGSPYAARLSLRQAGYLGR